MVAIFSIKPQYVSKILSGTKRVEYRRIKCANPIEKILIYSTSPVSRIVGEVSIIDVLVDSVASIWESTKEYAGLNYEEYAHYYRGKKGAVAYVLSNPIKYSSSLTLTDIGIIRAPQSFCYLANHNLTPTVIS